MTKKKRGSAVALIFFLTAIALFLLSLVSLSGHSCTGEHCEFCLFIEGTKRLIESLAGIFIAASIAYVFSLCKFKRAYTKRAAGLSESPVLLGVQLLC